MAVVQIEAVDRSTALNECEGTLTGRLDGDLFTCHVLDPEAEWSRYRIGESIDVDVWLERTGELSVLPTGTPPEIRQIEGCVYELTGVVVEREGQDAEVQATRRFRVDLDLTPFEDLPDVQVGDTVRLRAMLQAELG